MNKWGVAAIALVVGTVASVVVVMRGPAQRVVLHPRDHGQEPEPSEKAKQVETIRGVVVELPGGGRGGGDAKGPGAQGPSAPLITLRTDAETIRIHAGPPRFHSQIGLALAEKDTIEVTGTRQGTGAKTVLAAQTIKKEDRVFRIRGENGEKLWQPNAKPTPIVSTISGEVVNLAPELMENVPGRDRSGMIIALQTTAGKIAVQLGPESYRTQRGLTIEIGDHLDVSGWQLPGAVVADLPVMLAGTIRKGNQELRIRDDQRRALWTAE